MDQTGRQVIPRGGTENLVEALSRSVLFAGWASERVRVVARRFQPWTVQQGAVVCEEGKAGHEMYVIEEGRFVVESAVGDDRVHLAELGPGSVFGEMALLFGQRRSATVTALTASRLWVLGLPQFQELMGSSSELQVALGQLVAERANAASRLKLANEFSTLLSLPGEKDTITIGRAESNDIVLANPQVSRVHAVIRKAGEGYEIIDLHSTNGTHVNGELIESRALKNGDQIWIGPHQIFFDAAGVTEFSRGSGVKVDAIGLTKEIKPGVTTLNDLSLSIYPGEFVCIVGGSGAGKTTLMDALNGFRPVKKGKVLLNGVNYYEHFDAYRNIIGYVPQDDIVHPEAPVYQTLYYAARLRLPNDTKRSEINERIDGVLETLELSERRDNEVRQLSGGQRKRVSIGVELLTEPGIFYLDEPTSGLDPGLDGRMMDLFRKLADQGRTVIMTTHATKNIMLCDKVVFLARGGRLAFFGSPGDALTYFGVTDFADIYARVEFEDTPDNWQAKFRQSEFYRRNVQQRVEDQSPLGNSGDTSSHTKEQKKIQGASWLRQLVWLSARYFNILRRDRVALALLLLQAPLVAGAVSLTFSHNVYAVHSRNGGDARQGVLLLFIIAIASIWLGANNASRAMTGEIPVYTRERLINLKIMPYVLSKVAILGLFALLQSVLLVGILSQRIHFPGATTGLLELFLALALTNLAGVGMGLLVSSISGSSLQATLIVVMFVTPQLVLAGASVPISQMTSVAKVISGFMISRWSLSLMGTNFHLNARLHAQLTRGTTNQYASQFNIDPVLYAGILVGICLVCIAGAAVGKKTKDVR
ncbi:MAG: ATP-binding cassette domain-containing protein [Chloroflexota bacterium]